MASCEQCSLYLRRSDRCSNSYTEARVSSHCHLRPIEEVVAWICVVFECLLMLEMTQGCLLPFLQGPW